MNVQVLSPWALAALLLLPWVLWCGWIDGRLPAHRRRWSLLLRSLVLSLVVLALARPRLVRPVDLRSAALLLDRSDSVPAAEQARAERFAVAAAAATRPDRLLALVSFGERAMVERGPREGDLEPLRALVPGGRTDVGAGLRLGAAVLPAESSRRLVLLSDGRHNKGALEPAVALAEAAGIPVDVLPMAAAIDPAEMLVEGLDLPAASRVGQSFEVTARLRAHSAGPARVRIYRGAAAILDRQVDLAAGETRLGASVTVTTAGEERFKVVLEPRRDGRWENNEADGVSLVAGPPRVLLVAADEARAAPVVAALRQARRTVDVMAPEAMPANILALAGYQAVILVDIPARRVAPAAMTALRAAVRDLGKGLLMVGGSAGFGAGGWRGTPVEQALPVEMQVQDKDRRPGIALSFVVDQSGSMGDAQGEGGTQTKLDLAKEAVLQAAGMLRADDEVAVTTFDDSAHGVWPRAPNAAPEKLAQAVAGIPVGGGTNIQAGLAAAVTELERSDRPLRHIVLLTDGWSDSSGYESLLRRLRDAQITLSVVAAGRDSAPFLKTMADRGGGRHYEVEDAAQIPRIVVEETLTRMGTYLVEEPFRPQPGSPDTLLAGIDVAELPRLNGYDATTSRSGATVALTTHLGDPLLAHWQYGMGRAVAWTSDLESHWAGAWMSWPQLESFILRLVDWTLPPPDNDDLQPDIDLRFGRARLSLRIAGDEVGAMENLSAEAVLAADRGEAQVFPLRQVAAGLYEVEADLPGQGAYGVRFTVRSAGRLVAAASAGLVVPYSPEYADPGAEATDPRLGQLAARTGGRVLSRPEQAFDAVRGSRSASEAWPFLLTLAALLFPLDVAVRRLTFGAADRAALLNRLRRGRRRDRRPGRVLDPLLGSLGAAKRRARREEAEGLPAAPAEVDAPELALPPTPRGAIETPSDPSAGEGEDSRKPVGDTLARLREAKRRASRPS